ncbi:uncharacterized protein LODBEIA_P44770 [Lodderomyces beijingensis]|uniref:Uncharacterized protein n=1 Tax=Lodderomyces beijingensis TaxID=1775926 RepID=A0ABP0ZQ24_9ASCO
MPSPILISNSSGYFTLPVVIRSIAVTTSGIWTSPANSHFYTAENIHSCLKYIAISLLIYFLSSGPLLLAKLLMMAIHNERGFQIVKTVQEFCSNHVVFECFSAAFLSFFDSDLERLFLMNLKHTDELNGGTNYGRNYLKLPDHNRIGGWDFKSFKRAWKFNRQFKFFLKRYTNYLSLNAVVFCCIYILPQSLASSILAFISFQALLDKFGTQLSIVYVALLQMTDLQYRAMFITTYFGAMNLAQDLLIPYFNRVNFTNSEQEQWINTRKGVLFGIGIIYFIAIHKTRWISMLIYSNAFFNMGSIITRITSEIPANSKELSAWATLESVWDGHEKFVGEGTS